MHDDARLVQMRINRFVTERLQPAIIRESVPARVERWEAPGEPVRFEHAIAQPFEPVRAGVAWGRPWGTTWFKVTGMVPAGWADAAGARVELVIDLGFNSAIPGFQAEGMVFSEAGSIIKAVEPLNTSVPLAVAPGETFTVYVEAASNPDLSQAWTFAPTAMGDPETAGDQPMYRLTRIDIALRDTVVWELGQDFWTLHGLYAQLPTTLPRRAEILRALDRAVDAVDPHDVAGTAQAGREVLAPALAAPAWHSSHRVHAVGHAHIDSAWLWPLRETVRKVARTFSNVDALIEQHPDFVFAASSAQQYAWLKEHYPELFERIRRRVAEGSFVPVGGMWVESDSNLPGGEALARQFVAGKRFFIEEFGVEPLEVWLPDSFGYSGALPQIARAAGSRWFLTQKISWNETNVMPHHTFHWEGIDGTRIFTHFPPVDTYSSELSGADLARAQRQYSEKGVANTSLVPFGWGDGGGGPTEEMIAAARRTASLEGSPKVLLSSPRGFFEAAEAEYPHPPVWSGELYLEFHRGTYTSQARTKRGNRRSEHLLREAELWAATAAVRGVAEYPYETLEQAWHTVLLLQFHDILPGSSIAWVHREAERRYDEVRVSLEQVIDRSVRALAGEGSRMLALNSGPFAQRGVIALAAAEAAPVAGTATVSPVDGGFVFRNDRLEATLDADGLLVSLRDQATGREAIPAGESAKVLQLFRDTPRQWDAWDIDADYVRTMTELRAAESVEIVQAGPDQASVRITRRFGSSSIEETVTLEAGARALDVEFAIDWHERQKLLKLAFPLDVQAAQAASEIQFGHILRPTHANTSWDAARFETVAHRWVHVGEPGYGVAVANDSTYGHDIRRSGEGRSTTVRLSLLRAPLYPDPESDQGEHRLRVAIAPGVGIPEAIEEGYRLNLPLRSVAGVGAETLEPLLRVRGDGVVVEAVKLAEDQSGDVILRLYEAHGGRAVADLSAGFEVADVWETDLLERSLSPSGDVLGRSADGSWRLELRPFQLVTLRFRR
ncbi:glycoside hydrolase family 38 C-terminal domain-containing protein [Diaminobutyricimonas sp. TR449]|uniref:glycoside hydrolase family 38 N-terminal domain-containing protein n=1 Tax=Diaminobutyricimonas sp. TR449 TaxID=2708076 RepID=UPI0014208338|nr:glycoside hydrolase family 38 C-terminal domain-containing protein [Diaminobutyricimonas sp. TR449]